jgi:ATP-dependent helicase/nuclease subunit A
VNPCSDLGRNLLVEASAGTGKTYTLVHRLREALLSGRHTPGQVAAVTFTRKAAAELRSRLRLALEEAGATSILAQFDHLFIGTVHSFCASLLRRYPFEAGIGPDFEELEENADQLLQRKTFRRSLQSPAGQRLVRLLQEFEAEPKDLYPTLHRLCDHGEVSYRVEPVPRPDPEPVWSGVDELLDEIETLLPAWQESATCPLFTLLHQLIRKRPLHSRESPADLLQILQALEKNYKPIKRYWGSGREQQNLLLAEVTARLENFQQHCGQAHLSQWRAHLYWMSIEFLEDVREQARQERLSLGRLNFHDLLFLCARLLRSQAQVRHCLQRQLGMICVDEFQDTDPLQAEIFFLLAASESRQADWTKADLRAGSLFLVGDPKQSIYRFRRADMATYLQARQRILDSSGEVLSLEQSFRSRPALCQWNNWVFGELLPRQANPFQARSQDLVAVREGAPAPSIERLVQDCERSQVTRNEAQDIAGLIQLGCQQGQQAEDFLILTSRKAELVHYQQALQAAGMACQVSAEPVPLSAKVVVVVRLLQALARKHDRIGMVGLLRGELFGHSDADLYQHFQGGGHPLVEESLQTLEQLRQNCEGLPLGAAVESALQASGLGHCLTEEERGGLIDYFSQCTQAGLTLMEACQDLLEAQCISLPPNTGEGGVRIMNLHKAKGLEAKVVFLAAPSAGLPIWVEQAIQGLEGRTCIRKEQRLLACPQDWRLWEDRERQFLEAEHIRLLYVATTRARDRLIVGEWSGQHGAVIKPWAPLQPFLTNCPILPALSAQPTVEAPDGSWTAGQLVQAKALRAEQEAHCRKPSWERHSVTGSQDKATFVSLGSHADGGPGGAAWGDLIHRLLEHLVRHPDCSRLELERLARWVALDEPEVEGYWEAALEEVERLQATPFWQEVLQSKSRLVEIPIGHRLGDKLLFGTIDLALEKTEGWAIVDYKTDRKTMAELLAHYAGQVQQYAHSWSEITQEKVESGSIYSLREVRLGQVAID